MKNYAVRLYQKEDFTIWNSFVADAKNATFLYDRNFMEYHSNRFLDFSLMVFDADSVVAVVPLNRVDSVVYSHEGLTYGGIILSNNAKLTTVISVYKNILQFLNHNNIAKVVFKLIPSFYCDAFSDELEYCLFVSDAKVIRVDSLSTLDLKQPFTISKTRKESIRRGIKNNLNIIEESNFDSFWNQILIPNLATKHEVKPVHTLKEITYIKNMFPYNIRQFNVYDGATIVAGTTVFVNKNVVHPQYISGNTDKNALGSLDYLYHHLITAVFSDKSFFDFGISNENSGKNINQGLLFWKESFGAKTVSQRFYSVETKNYELLSNVLV
jgi:hypothetical protein